ncbi:helix-turn-helix domain-containing protein [Plesiocystis pacifica]|uniref:helix-turn-helix domain-containing protein n=1 Tax=Plesiocystis pacifica TaxID=191768 RepID=UPI0012F7F602|nr:helix-turn-helix transcriptional regulator [Plesiocystis pacifica]
MSVLATLFSAEPAEVVRKIDPKQFGRHLRSLRNARGLTQELLAERSDLSSDTIRRLEAGTFSPSLNTLAGVASGLRLRLSTLFMSYEDGSLTQEQEIVDMLLGRSSEELDVLVKVLRVLLDK